MPEICRFLGIVITMYFNDHNPPHFHVRYEDFRAIVGIDPLELREGSLPPRVLGLVMEWAELHQAELRENWTTLAAEGKSRAPNLMKHVCVAARIGDGEALDAGNIQNIGKSSNDASTDSGCNPYGLARVLAQHIVASHWLKMTKLHVLLRVLSQNRDSASRVSLG